MKYSKSTMEPGILVLTMSGRFLMGSDCQQVSGEIDSAILRGDKSFIFDMTGVDHVDSAAVGQIVKCYSKLKKVGGTLRLAGVGGMVDRVLKMTHVHKVIPIFPTAADAGKDFPSSKS
jgi:anti-anti-sigma factor